MMKAIVLWGELTGVLASMYALETRNDCEQVCHLVPHRSEDVLEGDRVSQPRACSH